MKTNATSLKKKLLYSLILTILFFALIEIILRSINIDTYFQNRFFVLNRALDYPEVFTKDKNLLWRLKRDQTVTSKFFENQTYHINSNGLRGDEIKKPPGTPRILALGNSCTFGWGVKLDQTFVKVLETRLDKNCEVINGGIPGYTSLQGRRFFESELIKLKPDIMLILFAWNDHWAAASQIADKDQQFPPQLILNLQNRLNGLHFYRLLKKAVLSSVEPTVDSLFDRVKPVYRVQPDDFRDNLRAIVKLALANNIKPLLLTSPIPSLENYYPTGSRSNLHTFHRGYNEITRAVAAELNIDLVDLAKIFDEHKDLFDDVSLDPIHFNAKGHRLAGEAIASYLTANVLK